MDNMEETTYIGRRKKPTEAATVSHVMEAMPIPADWGIGPAAAVGKGHLRLVSGRIRFVRLDKSLLDVLYPPEETQPDYPTISPVAMDPADRLLGKDRRRGLRSRQRSVDLFDMERRLRAQLPFPDRSDSGFYELDEDARLAASDYKSAREVEQTRSELETLCRRLLFNAAELGVVTLLLCLIELLPAFGVPTPSALTPEGSPLVYLLLSLAGLGLAAFLAGRDLLAGLRNLLDRRFNIRTAVAVAVLTELLHVVYMLAGSLLLHNPVPHTFAAPVCLAVLVYTVNRLLHSLRVAGGFALAARHGIHGAVRSADDSPAAADLRRAAGEAEAHVAYVVRTRALGHYFRRACREDRCSRMMTRVYPYLLLGAVCAALVAAMRGLLLHDDCLNMGFSALSASLVTAVPLTGLLCLEIPLSSVTARLRSRGALLTGWDAVDRFGQTDAFAINTTDLFPRGSVKVRRSFAVGEMEIEEVTMAAASVTIASGGALAEVFGELIGDDARLRESVDGVEYESELGVSAWLREKRILVGNRAMMELHRVVVPGGGLARLDEFEIMRGRPGHQVLYVAVNNRLMGVYLLEYKASMEARSALVRLISDGANVMIYTCDANIDIQLITRVFDVPARFISILDNQGSRTYDAATCEITDREEALLATDGSLRALSEGIRGAVRLKENERLGLLVQGLCFGVGFLFVAGLSCLSPYAIDAAEIIIMQLAFVLISLLSVLRSL